MSNSFEQNDLKNNISESEIRENLRQEILSKLKLYHVTTLEKWNKIQKSGALYCEAELVRKGFISREEADDLSSDASSTGELDRSVGRDEYIFFSTKKMNYGEVTLEMDLDALNIPGALVATAGDWLNFSGSEDDIDYFNKSIIPASQFIDYLVDFLPTLPNKDWFWLSDKNNEELRKFIGEGLMDKVRKKDNTKNKIFNKLYPEIMFPKEVPLSYIKSVVIDEEK